MYFCRGIGLFLEEVHEGVVVVVVVVMVVFQLLLSFGCGRLYLLTFDFLIFCE